MILNFTYDSIRVCKGPYAAFGAIDTLEQSPRERIGREYIFEWDRGETLLFKVHRICGWNTNFNDNNNNATTPVDGYEKKKERATFTYAMVQHETAYDEAVLR